MIRLSSLYYYNSILDSCVVQVNFTDIAHRNEAERRAQEERQTKLQEMKNEKLRKIEEQIAGMIMILYGHIINSNLL